jgi:hypothetical protein
MAGTRLREAHSYTIGLEPNGLDGWNLMLRRSTREPVLEVRAIPLGKALDLVLEAVVRDCQAPGNPVVFAIEGRDHEP